MSELATYVLRLVARTRTGYDFTSGARECLSLALDDLFAADCDRKLELEALLRLGWLFEIDHRSPAIAEKLARWIADDPRALATLGVTSSRAAAALRRRFARFGGGQEPLAAPRYGAAAPNGAVKAHHFIDPGVDPRRLRRAAVGREAVARTTVRSSRRRFELG